MDTRIGDLRCKEVINVTDGTRYGYVGDVEVDLETGQVRTLVVPGRLRLFGLLGREAERVFSWSAVRRFGEDIILVEGRAPPPPGTGGDKIHRKTCTGHARMHIMRSQTQRRGIEQTGGYAHVRYRWFYRERGGGPYFAGRPVPPGVPGI